jgi:hypothetical protein
MLILLQILPLGVGAVVESAKELLELVLVEMEISIIPPYLLQ